MNYSLENNFCRLTRKVLLVACLLSLLNSCLNRRRQWVLETPVQDVVSHTFLQRVGVNVLELPERRFDPELAPFVQQFLIDAKKRNVIIPNSTRDKLLEVVYVDKLSMKGGPGVMASCNRYFSYVSTIGGKKKLNWMTIEVLKSETEEYIGNGKGRTILLRELMYHEIFHCLLNKSHLPEQYSGIMSPTFAKGSKRAFKEWEALVDDMFSPLFMSVIPDAN